VVINRSSGVIHSVTAVFHSPVVTRVGYQQGYPHRNRCSANRCSGEQVYDEQVFALRSRETSWRDFFAKQFGRGQPYIPFCVHPISDRFIQTRSDGDRLCGARVLVSRYVARWWKAFAWDETVSGGIGVFPIGVCLSPWVFVSLCRDCPCCFSVEAEISRADFRTRFGSLPR